MSAENPPTPPKKVPEGNIVSTYVSNLVALFLKQQLRNGRSINIPSLGITIRPDDSVERTSEGSQT